jgi:hypothetical protein
MNATDFVRNDAYLRFKKHHHDWDYDDSDDDNYRDRRITIDYIGILLDEEGYPMIDEISLQACYYYCLKMMMMEDFLLGKVPPVAFEFIDESYGKYVQKARSSFKNVSRNDMDEITMILYNMVPKIRLPREMT